MDAIKELLSGAEGGFAIPTVADIMTNLELVLRIASLVGPLCLLGLGLVYLLASPKEANHSLGYRFYWGMSSVEVWQFTQRLAGVVWTVLGLALCIVMAVRCNGYRALAQEEMIWKTLNSLVWELGCVVVSILVINLTVFICFDRKGYRRRRNRR